MKSSQNLNKDDFDQNRVPVLSMKYLLFFLLLIPLVNANSFGVSPSQIEMQGFSEFYIINSNNFKTKFKLESEVVNFDKNNFYLEPLEKTKIKINQKSKNNGIIEILSGENLVSSLQIPIKFKEETKNITKQKIEIKKEKETKGFFLIIILNSIGLLLGGLIWKKKIFWPSQ